MFVLKLQYFFPYKDLVQLLQLSAQNYDLQFLTVHPLNRSNKLLQTSIFTAFHLIHHFSPTGPSFSTMSLCYTITISFNLCSIMLMYTYMCVYMCLCYVYVIFYKAQCYLCLHIVLHFFHILKVHLDVQRKMSLQTTFDNHNIIHNDTSFYLLCNIALRA